jgi:deazaflavin-dependent oxidoreductase (nitroreductase family)
VTRTNGLVYAPDGADYLVVPSNGGADQPPAWLFNLKARPEVEIQIGRERQKGKGRVRLRLGRPLSSEKRCRGAEIHWGHEPIS